MRKYQAMFLGVVSLSVIAMAIFLVKPSEDSLQKATDNRQKSTFLQVEQLLKEGKTSEALVIIKEHQGEIEQRKPGGREWLLLMIEAAVKAKDGELLTQLYEFAPQQFVGREEASLLVANEWIKGQQQDLFDQLRLNWKGKETQLAAWHVLDVDRLLLQGLRLEAIELLKSEKFEGREDVGRLVRLGLLYSVEDPKGAWKYLTEAQRRDPANASIRSFRGQLLQSVGAESFARHELVEALRLRPGDKEMIAQLADFYISQKEYRQALDIWRKALGGFPNETFLLKATFWSKLVKPESFNVSDMNTNGNLFPLIEYLQALPKGTFWDNTAFQKLEEGKQYLTERQETYWLRVFQAIKEEKWELLSDLLSYNPFATTSWYPQLEKTLERILQYRKHHSLQIDNPQIVSRDESFKGNSFIERLEQWALIEKKEPAQFELPDALHNLLMSREVFSALMNSVGWYEVGLQLHQEGSSFGEFPAWVAYNMTVALQNNRSIDRAYRFVNAQRPSNSLNLLKAELLISSKRNIEALKQLESLRTIDSEVGYRAAWLASLLYIEQKEWQKARMAIAKQQKLANDTLGKETLARIAYLEGNEALAHKLYLSIEKESAEARSFLAKIAFRDRQWTRARELTEALIQDFPNNMTLRKNLLQLIEEEAQQQN